MGWLRNICFAAAAILTLSCNGSEDNVLWTYRITAPQNGLVLKRGEKLFPKLDSREAILQMEFYLNDEMVYHSETSDDIPILLTSGLEPGRHKLSIHISSIGGQESVESVHFNLRDTLYRPEAKIEHGLKAATAGMAVEFTNYNSSDRDSRRNELLGRWRFGENRDWDTDFIALDTVSYTYSKAGKYRVVTEIMDGQGQRDTAESSIRILEKDIFNIEMVAVEGGEFIMGGSPYSRKQHFKALLNDFWISKYEVTHRQFLSFLNSIEPNYYRQSFKHIVIDMKDKECRIERLSEGYQYIGDRFDESIDTPVIEVSWLGAVVFANWLSLLHGLDPVYELQPKKVTFHRDRNGYRLPTEAEWEYAAKGGKYDDQSMYAGGDYLDKYGWYILNSGLKLHKIGQKSPNKLGLYDMSGNAAEWCWDIYDAYPLSYTDNPLGADEGLYRVVRGGSAKSSAALCSVSERARSAELLGISFVGFRLARNN